jgi:hypothetical protein
VLPGVNFGQFGFPAVNFGVVDFGVMNWYPGFGYFDGYNPYWYFEAVAQADFLAMADAGLSEATFNVQSMKAGTISDANSMIADRLAMLAYLDQAGSSNHGDRYDIHTGRRWSMGRPSSVRLVDLTSNMGDVRWPLSAPNDAYLRDKRAAANTSIRVAVRDFRSAGSTSVEKVMKALNDLQSYASPAVDTLRRESPPEVNGFIDFVRNLDQGLRGLVGETNVQTIPKPKLEAPRRTRLGGGQP